MFVASITSLCYLPDMHPIESEALPPSDFTLQTPNQFWMDFNYRARESRGSVGLKMFLLESPEIAEELEKTFRSACTHGAAVLLQVDALSRARNDPFRIPATWYPRFLDKLERMGVTVSEGPSVHGVSVMKYVGRSHMKFAFVTSREGDDTPDVAWVGGVNFTREGLNRDDLMLRITDKGMVDALRKIHDMAKTSHGIKEDQIIRTGKSTIFVDSGAFMRSCILDRAVQIVDEVKTGGKLRVVTPFPPLGTMAAVLSRAIDRGVDVRIICADPGSLSVSFPGYYLRVSNVLRSGCLPIHLTDGFIHSKMIVTAENKQGRVFIGSHNFDPMGKMLKTQEIAVEVQDERLVAEALRYCDERLPS